MSKAVGRALFAGFLCCGAAQGCKSASFSGANGYRQAADRAPAKDSKKDDFLKNSAFPDQNTDLGGKGGKNTAGAGVDDASAKGPNGGGKGGMGNTAGGHTSGASGTGGNGGFTAGGGKGTAGNTAGNTAGPGGATAGGLGGNATAGMGGIGGNTDGATGGDVGNTAGNGTGKPGFDAGQTLGTIGAILGQLGEEKKKQAWTPLDQTDWWQYPHKCNGPEADDSQPPLFDHKLTMDECKTECQKRGFDTFKDCANPNNLSQDQGTSSIDPLVIDLTSRGVALSAPWDGVRFDIRGAGRKSQISWPTTPNTSVFLVLAPEAGGAQAQSVHSLFGDRTLGPDGQLAADGFAALAKWDQPKYGGNGDGMISAADAVWPRLRAWRNTARDGVLKPEELVALPDLGVRKIDVTPVDGRELDRFGNLTGRRSVVCLAGCERDDEALWTKSMIVDLWFRTDRSFTK